MKLLAFIPFGRLEPETLDSVLNQIDRPHGDIWLANDNPYSFEKRGLYHNIQLAYSHMAQVAVSQEYDWVWCVEADTVPPENALDLMLQAAEKHGAKVVSGLYALRHGEPVPNIHEASSRQNIGAAMSWEKVQRLWGQVIPMSGGCMGCLLIHTSVFEGFAFLDSNYDKAPDGRLMHHCNSLGIKQVAHLGVICGHIKPGGDMIVPSLIEKSGYTIEKRGKKAA